MVTRSIVLVVEDDVTLAEITCELIEAAGLSAVFRTTMADALDYFAKFSGTMAALFTDINLHTPMGGIELAVHVAAEWPDVAICVTSGIAHERPRQLPEKARFLAKPWRGDELVSFLKGTVA